MIRKVISGGQTGSDRAGLDAAIEAGIPHGGWCPAGRLASDGPISKDYNLQETEEATYPPRTEKNVREGDATVIFYRGPELSRGCALTKGLCAKHGKPCLQLDVAKVDIEESSRRIKNLVRQHNVTTLNVAGSRENKSPGIYYLTFEALTLALSEETLEES